MEPLSKTIGWSMIFFMSIVAHLFSIKWLNTKEGFTNAWPMIFWCSLCWLPTIPWSLVPLWRNRHIFNISKQNWIRLGIASFLFNLENIVLWILIQSVPLAVYIICRSSYNIYNPLLVRFYQKKPVSLLVWISIVLLAGSYGFLGADMGVNSSIHTEVWIVIVIILTSLMTCACSHILEHYFGTVRESELELHIHLIYNLYSGIGFLFTIPSAYMISQIDMTPIAWGLSCLSGAMFIGYVWSKNVITSFRQTSGNLVMGGIDLSRRVVSSLLAYTVLGEHLSGLLIGANVMMFASSIMIFIGIWNTYKHNILMTRLDSVSAIDELRLLEGIPIDSSEPIQTDIIELNNPDDVPISIFDEHPKD